MMHCKPQLLLNHNRSKPRISVILIDWGARESFHSLEYLNRQTASRDEYELIWLEFYDRKPEGLQQLAARQTAGVPMLDKWIVLGYPDDSLFHKHRLYNVGILAATGDICVICDSDAIFRPTFIESLIRAFAERPNAVIHLDEVRNVSRAYYPFNYPEIDDILGAGCINWRGETTLGLDNSPDMIHHANYGACMAARRLDLLAIRGADEDLDYLGYVCGPYELTFRLVNYGREEYWLRDEYLYHTWHPNQYGYNTDYQGPHDGAHMSLLALDARASFRVRPSQENPGFAHARRNGGLDTKQLVELACSGVEPSWQAGAQPPLPGERVYWVERDYFGFDLFAYAGHWYALRTGSGVLNSKKLKRDGYNAIWHAASQPELRTCLPINRERWEERENHAGWAGRLWRQFRAQPLHQLPNRIARRSRKLSVP